MPLADINITNLTRILLCVIVVKMKTNPPFTFLHALHLSYKHFTEFPHIGNYEHES